MGGLLGGQGLLVSVLVFSSSPYVILFDGVFQELCDASDLIPSWQVSSRLLFWIPASARHASLPTTSLPPPDPNVPALGVYISFVTFTVLTQYAYFISIIF